MPCAIGKDGNVDVVLVAAVGVVAGALTAVLLRLWPRPTVGAPQVARAVVRKEVARHARLRRVMRRRLDAEAITGLSLTIAVVVIVLALVGVGVLLRMVRSDTGLTRYDLAFARFGVRHASPWAVTTLRKFSMLGGAELLTVLAVVVAAVDYWRFRAASVLAFLLVTVGGQFLVANTVKSLVNRPRPDLERLTGFSGSSFPSGHATRRRRASPSSRCC